MICKIIENDFPVEWPTALQDFLNLVKHSEPKYQKKGLHILYQALKTVIGVGMKKNESERVRVRVGMREQ